MHKIKKLDILWLRAITEDSYIEMKYRSSSIFVTLHLFLVELFTLLHQIPIKFMVSDC